MHDRRQVSGGILLSFLDWSRGSASPHEIRWFKASEFVNSIGLNTHFGQPHTSYATAFETALPLLQDLGVRRLREDLGIGFREGADAAQFRRIRQAAAKGFRFSLICFDGFNHPVEIPTGMLNQIYDWSDGAVDYFEGPNEPAIVRRPEAPARLLDYQIKLYKAVRSSPKLKSVKVIGPSPIVNNVDASPNMSKFADFGNIHSYPGHHNPETKKIPGALEQYVKNSKSIFNGLDFIATETGYHSAINTKAHHLPVSEDIKARYTPRLLLWYFINGINATYLYEGVSSFNRGSADPESNFGLIRSNLTTTQSYTALKNLISQFGTSASRKTSLSVRVENGPADLVCAGFVKSDGGRLVALWRATEGWNAQTRTPLPQQAENVRLLLSGQPRDIRLHRFGDDGLLSTSSLAPSDHRLELTIDDRLALVAFS